MTLTRTPSEPEARVLAAAFGLSHGYCIFDGHYYVGPAQALRELGCSHIDFPAGWPEEPAHCCDDDCRSHGCRQRHEVSTDLAAGEDRPSDL